MKQFLVTSNSIYKGSGGGGTQLNQARKQAMSTKRERERVRERGGPLWKCWKYIYCYLNVSLRTAEKHLNKETVILVILFACAILKTIWIYEVSNMSC